MHNWWCRSVQLIVSALRVQGLHCRAKGAMLPRAMSQAITRLQGEATTLLPKQAAAYFLTLWALLNVQEMRGQVLACFGCNFFENNNRQSSRTSTETVSKQRGKSRPLNAFSALEATLG
jgi:hypothetical protein